MLNVCELIGDGQREDDGSIGKQEKRKRIPENSRLFVADLGSVMGVVDAGRIELVVLWALLWA